MTNISHNGRDKIMRRFALIVREFRLHSAEYANPDLITSECRLTVIIHNVVISVGVSRTLAITSLGKLAAVVPV